MPPKPGQNTPKVGDIYAFRTAPHNAFSPPETGRYAALAVLGVTPGSDQTVTRFAVSLLDGVWPQRPSWEDVCAAPLLQKQRPGWVKQPAAYGVTLGFDWAPDDLRDFHRVGTDRLLTDEDRAEAARILHPATFSANARLIAFDEMAEGEWRWRHDRAAYEAEVEQVKVKREADRLAYEERVRNRLSRLTWEQLLSETPFESWTPSPPYPSAAFAAAARETLHDTCRAFIALGPKPKKTAARKLLKQCVTWFNRADTDAGHAIETGEREDICAVLEEMAYVAGHPGLTAEIDEWREW